MVESELPIPMPEIPGYVATGKKAGKASDTDLPTAQWGPAAGTTRVRNRYLGGSSGPSSSSGRAQGMNGPPRMAFSGSPPVIPLPPAFNAASSSSSQQPSERSSGAGSTPSTPSNRQVPSVPPVQLTPPTPPPAPPQTSPRPITQQPAQFPPQPARSSPPQPQRPPLVAQPESTASPPAPAQFLLQSSMPPPVQIGTHQVAVQLPPTPARAQGPRQGPSPQFPANLVHPSPQLTSRPPLQVQSPPGVNPGMKVVKPQRGNGWLETEVPKDGFGLLGEALLCPLKITVIILIEFFRSRRKH